jgi:hypothetical protein
VPSDVEAIYQRGLAYLTKQQADDGSWQSGQSGVNGICLMAFLASGEDPNFGRYALTVRKGLRELIASQNPETGYFENSMYHHGFAMLALAEAYGAVDETMLWATGTAGEKRRSIGEALELAVRCAATSAKDNKWGAWRYSPGSNDADTSVAGAVLMGLLAARNAGIEVPDETVDGALEYLKDSTSENGFVAYSGGLGGMGESMNRSAVATLVYAVGKKKDWPAYTATLGHIATRLEHQESGYPNYFRYYMAQALFQGDYDSWEKWNRETIATLKDIQEKDGSFPGNHGDEYGTAMSLLALALNYRFLPIYER